MAEEFYTGAIDNWNHSVTSKPAKVFRAYTVDALRTVVKDLNTYPSPVRVAGNRHSTTACFVAEAENGTQNGTQVFLEGNEFKTLQMNTDGTLTLGGGVTMFKIAHYLKSRGRQLAVMPEIGNATAGSVACSGTKDSSFKIGDDKGYSQISSTVVAVKMVKADGTIECVDARKSDAEAERMRLIRSSYGLLGIVHEVTFKTEPLAFAQYTYKVLDLKPLRSLDELRDGANSMLGFMLPYDNKILVERRTLIPTSNTESLEDSVKSATRRKTWKCVAAQLAKIISTGVETPMSWMSKMFREVELPDIQSIFDSFPPSDPRHVANVKMVETLEKLLNDFRASRADCMLDFPEEGPYFDFTFWAFPVSKWERIVPEYLKFVHEYKDKHKFQKSLFTEVYLISKDNASFLTFSPDDDIFTLDMVHHDAKDEKWKEMNRKYNVFAAENGGLPLLNQTKELTTSPTVNGKSVVRATLGDRWKKFLQIVDKEGRGKRFMNDFFANL